MSTDCRAIMTGVKGVTATNNRAGGVELKFFTTSIQAGQELLLLQGHNVVISVEALDRLLLEEQQTQAATGTDGAPPADTEPANAEPVPLRRGGRRRREAPPAEEAPVENPGP